MTSQLASLGSLYASLAIIAPAVVLTGLALLQSAPGEWGRGALTAYVAVWAACVAGLAHQTLGPWVVLPPVVGFIALVIGGPWGALLAGLAAAGIAATHWLVGPLPVQAWLAPVLAACAIAAGIRGMM